MAGDKGILRTKELRDCDGLWEWGEAIKRTSGGAAHSAWRMDGTAVVKNNIFVLRKYKRKMAMDKGRKRK